MVLEIVQADFFYPMVYIAINYGLGQVNCSD